MKSTGVFQDEELLFSQTQQRDNDPDVDLFAASPKPAVRLSYDEGFCLYLSFLTITPYHFISIVTILEFLISIRYLDLAENKN